MPSQVVRTFVYHPEEGRLDIVFTTGRRYSYHGVPPQTAHAMQGAFAKGHFFNRHIRDRFAFTRQPDASPDQDGGLRRGRDHPPPAQG